MKRIKKYNDLVETNGPAYGKEETTKKGLKFTPVTTDNPTILDIKPTDDEEIKDGTFSDDETSIEMDEPTPVTKKKKTPKRNMRRIKNYKEVNESNGNLPFELDKRYRLEKDETFIEFYLTKIDVDKDEAYMKIVLPGSAHQGITLSSLIAAGPVLVEENKEENED